VEKDDTTVHYVIICYLGRPRAKTSIRSTMEVIDSVWRDPSSDFPEAPAVVQKILKDVASVSRKRYSLRNLKIGNR
jgi:hypothetical protein